MQSRAVTGVDVESRRVWWCQFLRAERWPSDDMDTVWIRYGYGYTQGVASSVLLSTMDLFHLLFFLPGCEDPSQQTLSDRESDGGIMTA